jgi:hypothetical protein
MGGGMSTIIDGALILLGERFLRAAGDLFKWGLREAKCSPCAAYQSFADTLHDEWDEFIDPSPRP